MVLTNYELLKIIKNTCTFVDKSDSSPVSFTRFDSVRSRVPEVSTALLTGIRGCSMFDGFALNVTGHHDSELHNQKFVILRARFCILSIVKLRYLGRLK